MGDVHRALDRSTGEVVAIKRVRAADADATQRFLRESLLLEATRHPGIVRYIAHGVDEDGSAWLAMEWLEGEDLCARLAREPLTHDQSLAIAATIADALGAAHQAGIVHRDVKPSNVFLRGGDPRDVRLLDFGIAKPLRATALTAAGSLLGTIGYLSPEQARGRQVDARSDVFSLACLLFECLTGRAAYHAEHAVAVFGKLLTEMPPAPSSVHPSLARFDALLAQMFAPLDQRLENGAAAARAIRALGSTSVGSVAPAAAPAKLTERERQALTVVLARPHGLDPDGMTEAADAAAHDGRRLAQAAAAAHARHELLPGGLLLFIWELDPARDQTVRAARFALALQHEGGLTSSLATGFGERTGSNAFGGVIDRAARLLARGDEGTVVLDPTSVEILRHRFAIDGARLGSELGRAHEIADKTQFVGREREMRLVTSLVDECVADGATRAILITADAGAGKSRLMRELLRRSAPERLWIARGDPMRPGSPYGMLAQLLRHAADMGATDTDYQRFVDTLRPLVADEAALELLAHVAAFPVEAPSAALRAAQSNPSVMAMRVRQEVEALCAAGASDGLLVVLLEDLHWADAPTLRLFESLVHVVERPIFIVGAARPVFHETFPGLWTGQNVEELRLAGLGRKAAEALARALRPDASSEAIRDAVDRAGGSPLWLEELFRHGADAAETPDSLLAVIQTHLALEPSSERLALRAAAIFGERAWLDGIGLLGGQSASEVEACVTSLAAKEWLVPLATSRFAGKSEVRFRHGLLRDAAYAALTEEDRRVGHRLAAEWLEAAGERDAISLAEHYERSEKPAAAIPHFAVAAHEASIANDLDGTIALAARGIALGASGRDLHRLLLAEGSSLCWRGKVHDGWRSLDRALAETATASEDPAFVSWAALGGAMNIDPSMSRRAADALDALDPDHCPSDDYQQAAYTVITALYWEGERERADEVLARLDRRPVQQGRHLVGPTRVPRGEGRLRDGARSRRLRAVARPTDPRGALARRARGGHRVRGARVRRGGSLHAAHRRCVGAAGDRARPRPHLRRSAGPRVHRPRAAAG